MKIIELFRRLSYGELSNLAIGSEGSGEIQEDQHRKIIGYVNEALLRLHSRFVLRENDLIIETQEHITNYRFTKAYAKSNLSPPAGTVQYIMDQGDPFEEDLIKILNVHSIGRAMLPLNDVELPYSLFTPQPNLLQVPRPVQGQPLFIVYQARHPIITADDLEYDIDVPYVLEGALTSYVASLVFSHMNGQENSAKSLEYMSRYEMICDEIEEKDLVNSSVVSTQTKFDKRGFQ